MQQLGDCQRLDLLLLFHYVNTAVGTHSHGGAQDVLRLGRSGGESEDVFDRVFALAHADGLFDRKLVERVHTVLDTLGLDGGVCLVDTRFDLNHALAMHCKGCFEPTTHRDAWERAGLTA